MRRLLGIIAPAVLALALSSCAMAPGPSPSASSTPSTSPTTPTVTVKTDSGKTPLKLRHIPSQNGTELAAIPTGTSIIITCQVQGSTIAGTQGSTAVWDHLTYQGKSGYVSAAYVIDGAASTIPACPYTAAVSSTPLPIPTATPSDAASGVIAIARSQLGVAEKPTNCNPYYPKKCEPWAAHFAVWVWQQAGITITDQTTSTGVHDWAKANKRLHDGVAGVRPGDLVLYGTAPGSKTSTHVDVVVATYPDHLHVIGGNVDDRVTERDVPLTGIYAWVGLT